MPQLQSTLLGRFVERMRRTEIERIYKMLAVPRQPYTGPAVLRVDGQVYDADVVEDRVVRATVREVER